MNMIMNYGDLSIDVGVFATAEDCLFGVAELEQHLNEAPKLYADIISSLSKMAAIRMTEPRAKPADITAAEFKKSAADLIPPTGLAGNEPPVRRLLAIARKGLAAQQFGTARVFKALAIARAGELKKALAPVFVERERAAKAEAIAQRQRLQAQRRADAIARDPALAKAAKEAQIMEQLRKVTDHLSTDLAKMSNDVADLDRRLGRLENQHFDLHAAAQPVMSVN